MEIVALIISIALGGLGVWIVSKLVPGFELRGGAGSALLVGAVYGALKYLFGAVLIVLALPLVVLTLGFFVILINALLLWLTDKLLDRLTIRSFGALLLSTITLSLVDVMFTLVLGASALY